MLAADHQVKEFCYFFSKEKRRISENVPVASECILKTKLSLKIKKNLVFH